MGTRVKKQPLSVLQVGALVLPLLVDQSVKLWFVRRGVIQGFYNTGIIGQTLAGHQAFTLGLNSLAVIFVLILYFYGRPKEIQKTSMLLVLSGSLSNLFDRCLYGYVIDYLRFPWVHSMNAGDLSICLGVVLMIIWSTAPCFRTQ